jgi:hypothetical protein
LSSRLNRGAESESAILPVAPRAATVSFIRPAGSGFEESMPPYKVPLRFLSVGFAVIGVALGWVAANRRSRDRMDKQDRRIQQLTTEETDLRERLRIAPRVDKYDTANNAELKAAARAFIARLQAFNAWAQETQRLGSTQARLGDAADKISSEFQTKFRAEGISLRNELRRRVPKQALAGPVPFVAAWDFGVLAGANPIGDAITELQRLVDLL